MDWLGHTRPGKDKGMELQQPPRNHGDKVFVNLGYATAKAGQIVGGRVTAVGGQKDHTIEYLVAWFGGKGERSAEQEWFAARAVFETAEGAF